MNSLKRCWRLSPVTFAAGLVLPLALLMQPAAAQDRKLDPDVERLLRQRLTVLEEVANLEEQAYRTGSTSFSSTLVARQAVLEAKLELAKDAAERVQIREEMLKSAQALERAAEALTKAAEAPRTNLLAASANRLRAEADLLLERKAAAR